MKNWDKTLQKSLPNEPVQWSDHVGMAWLQKSATDSLFLLLIAQLNSQNFISKRNFVAQVMP